MTTIVLAEDDPDIRHLISYKLSRYGFDIVPAADGVTALAATLRHPPDLVILDVQMPKLGGIEVCQEIRSNRETAKVPILMLTARTSARDLDLAFAAGADDYMVKPFSPRELLQRIETVLARVRA